MASCAIRSAVIASWLAACSVQDVAFTAPLREDCSADGDEDRNGLADCDDETCFETPSCRAARCTPEVCDGLDNDCSGVADDHEALGTAAACAAESCAAIRDRNPASVSGTWWVAPLSRAPFRVYCDQRTDGGGWALVWRNHGGSKGAEESNAALLARAAAGRGDAVVLPLAQTITSSIHQGLYDAYWGTSQREWIKLTALWSNDGTLVNQQHIRVELRDMSMRAIFEAPVDRCFVAPTKIRVTVNSNVAFGETDRINHYAPDSFGLANNGNMGQDLCNQPTENLIRDPVGTSLFRLDQGDSTNGIRHLFSYVHTSMSRDASRCVYACWETTMPTHYDAWAWGVR